MIGRKTAKSSVHLWSAAVEFDLQFRSALETT